MDKCNSSRLMRNKLSNSLNLRKSRYNSKSKNQAIVYKNISVSSSNMVIKPIKRKDKTRTDDDLLNMESRYNSNNLKANKPSTNNTKGGSSFNSSTAFAKLKLVKLLPSAFPTKRNMPSNDFFNSSNSYSMKRINQLSMNIKDFYKIKNDKKPNELLKISHSVLNIHNHHSSFVIKKYSCLSKAGEGCGGFTKLNQDSYLSLFNCLKKTSSKTPNTNNTISIFGVFDGHGDHGHFVSRAVKKSIEDYFNQDDVFFDETGNVTLSSFLRRNKYEVIHKAFEKASDSLIAKKFDSTLSGTTCILVFVINDLIICANVGDSRAVLYSNSNKMVKLSKDHKPTNKGEYDRIVNTGGTIHKIDDSNQGPYRVWVKYKNFPGLAISRSIGDFIAEKIGVISIPEIKEQIIWQVGCHYIVIGSDGLWEWFTNEEIGKIVFPFYKDGNSSGASQALLDAARKQWLRKCNIIDDITVIVIFFETVY